MGVTSLLEHDLVAVAISVNIAVGLRREHIAGDVPTGVEVVSKG